MKNILIVGKNSYVGISVKKYLEQDQNNYHVVELDVKSDDWQKFNFSKIDVVFYVAGIAHINSKKEMEKKKDLYYKVNTELAEKVAKKAKESGVKQFIYMSSMSVYGDSAPIGKQKVIKKNTKPNPTNIYGDSKLKAEELLKALMNQQFKVALLRPPMIYGKDCKGNYQTLRKIALKLPIFPRVKNSRSMIFIDNFAEFVKQTIDEKKSGIYCPTNKKPITTCEMVKYISECHNKRIIFISGFGWLLKIIGHFTPVVNKAFGNMTYDSGISEKYDYCLYETAKSIEIIENS